MAFNALAYAKDLENAGVPQAQATAQAQALHRAFENQKTELATKGDLAELRADFADLRADFADLRADFEGLRADTRIGLTELRAEMRSEIGGLRGEVGELRAEVRSEVGELRIELGQLDGKLTSQISQLETRLTRWMLIAAGFGGGIAGGLAILSKFIQ